jgi:predicted GNAT family acetyltransferase
MSLKVSKNEESSRFEAHLDGELAGFADYKLRGDTVVFPHTEVDPKFGGKGIGSALIEFALDSVESDGFKVAPICPFVAKTISKNPEKYLHLVPESQRAKYKLI